MRTSTFQCGALAQVLQQALQLCIGMPVFSHHGRRLRRDVIPVLGHPDYFLIRLRGRRGERVHKKIPASRSDSDRRPFTIDFEIRRRLRGRREGYGKALKATPARSTWNRWDLVVTLQKRRIYFNRAVGLSATPLCTDAQGFEIEPRFISALEAHLFEVHHVDDDVKCCVSDALHVLHKEYHRSLRRRA